MIRDNLPILLQSIHSTVIVKARLARTMTRSNQLIAFFYLLMIVFLILLSMNLELNQQFSVGCFQPVVAY